jgi:hypothetical protein
MEEEDASALQASHIAAGSAGSAASAGAGAQAADKHGPPEVPARVCGLYFAHNQKFIWKSRWRTRAEFRCLRETGLCSRPARVVWLR